MEKILVIDAEKCAGCRTCEATCSFHHEKEFNPSKSRIRILKWEEAGLDLPTVCLQCDIPLCEKACPVKALSRETETGAILIDYDACIGCKMCVMACPFGGVSMDMAKRKPIKCDLCGGKPACAEFCPTGAITYMNATKANLRKRRTSIEKLSELVRKG